MATFTEAQLKAKLIIDPPGELRFIGKLNRKEKTEFAKKVRPL